MTELLVRLWAALEGPVVDALQLMIAAAGLLGAMWLRERAARIAARHGALHAELQAAETGERGADKMDVARTHAAAALGFLRPRRGRMERLIEQEIPAARRASVPPPRGRSS